MGALDGPGGRIQDLLARRDIAGQRHHRDVRVIDQRRAHSVAASDDDVDDAGRKDAGDQTRELQRRKRRLLGRFEHHCIPARESGGQFPRRHHQRIVPRRDRGDDADRIAPDHRGMAREIFARRRSVHRPDGAGEVAEAVDDRRDLVVQRLDPRLAAVQRLERSKGFRVALDGVGELQEQARALRGRRGRPRLERGPGRLDCVVHLARRGLRQIDQQRLRLRIENALPGLAAGDERVADEHVGVEHQAFLLEAGIYLPAPATCSPSRDR